MVVNLKHKHQKIGVKSKAGDKKNSMGTAADENVSALEDLDQGIAQLVNYNSFIFFLFWYGRHLARLPYTARHKNMELFARL